MVKTANQLRIVGLVGDDWFVCCVFFSPAIERQLDDDVDDDDDDDDDDVENRSITSIYEYSIIDMLFEIYLV